MHAGLCPVGWGGAPEGTIGQSLEKGDGLLREGLDRAVYQMQLTLQSIHERYLGPWR